MAEMAGGVPGERSCGGMGVLARWLCTHSIGDPRKLSRHLPLESIWIGSMAYRPVSGDARVLRDLLSLLQTPVKGGHAGAPSVCAMSPVSSTIGL